MARIAGINIPPHQHSEIGLTAILVLAHCALARFVKLVVLHTPKKVKDLTDGDLENS